jgi:hypothetical protein
VDKIWDKESRSGESSEVFCRSKESPSWFWETNRVEDVSAIESSKKRKLNNGDQESTQIAAASPKKKAELRPAWSVGDIIFVNIDTWYSPDSYPFPKDKKWFCEGVITNITKTKRYIIDFPALGETYTKQLNYLKVWYFTLSSCYHLVVPDN